LDGPLAETEHIGALGVLSAASAFIEWELAVRVYFALKTLEEGFAGWAGTGAAVGGARP
jgi:hypothetical protein